MDMNSSISVNLCMVALGTSAIVLHRSDSDRTLLLLSAMYDVVPGSRAVCSYTGPSPRIRLGQWLFICRRQFNSRLHAVGSVVYLECSCM